MIWFRISLRLLPYVGNAYHGHACQMETLQRRQLQEVGAHLRCLKVEAHRCAVSR